MTSELLDKILSIMAASKPPYAPVYFLEVFTSEEEARDALFELVVPDGLTCQAYVYSEDNSYIATFRVKSVKNLEQLVQHYASFRCEDNDLPMCECGTLQYVYLFYPTPQMRLDLLSRT